MRKLVCIVMLFAALACCLFAVSCSNEELDHVHEYKERTLDADGAPCEGPSCTKDAKKEKICVICNDIVLLEVLPAKGHNPNDWQIKTEATCTVNKVEEKLCADCGDVVETKVHPANGHKAGQWQTVTNPTCTVNEVKGKLCTVCGELVETSVEPLQGHTKSEEWQIVTNASCTENLVKGKSCTKCGEIVETFVGEKLEHDYDEATVLGTCSKGEHKLYTCKLCGYFFESEFLKPTEAHTEGGWVIEKAATCSSEGVMMQICNSCGESLNRQNIPVDPNNHSFLVETFPPVNDDVGYTKYTCKSCGYEIKNAYESTSTPAQIYEMIASSTVRIEGLDKNGRMQNLGTGFFISAEGEIVTNYHVIAGAYQLKVVLYSGEEYMVTAIRGYSVANDMAVLKIDKEGNSYLKISTTEVKTGDPVYALGSPLGVDGVFTSGIVSNPSKKVNNLDMIVFSAPISSGNSGGPLVNARGEVVGINNQIADKGQNLNFALPAKMIMDLELGEDKAVNEVYAECMKTSGLSVLAYYLLLNYDRRDGDRFIIEIVAVEEADGKYGRTVQLVYDNNKKEIVISTNWVDSGKLLYSIEFVLDGIKNEYKVRFFDHGWSQYTVEGTVSTATQAISTGTGVHSSVFDKIFKFAYVNYGTSANNSTLTASIAKQLVGIAYVDMLSSFNTILEESGTDLTLDIFNFQLPQIPEQE